VRRGASLGATDWEPVVPLRFNDSSATLRTASLLIYSTEIGINDKLSALALVKCRDTRSPKATESRSDVSSHRRYATKTQRPYVFDPGIEMPG